MNAYDIIQKPIISEDSMSATADRKYTFRVDRRANKVEIARAAEEIFGVKVERVTTMNYDGKPKRMGSGRPGRRPAWKKAIIKLTPDSKTIELFESM